MYPGTGTATALRLYERVVIDKVWRETCGVNTVQLITQKQSSSGRVGLQQDMELSRSGSRGLDRCMSSLW